MYDEFKTFGKIVKNSCGPTITNKGSFSFFENGKSLLPSTS
jgi:hypothetical protein